MPLFQITLFVEPEIEGDAEIEISRLVEAGNIDAAMDLAKKLRDEVPEIDPYRITSWHIEEKTPDRPFIPTSNLA